MWELDGTIYQTDQIQAWADEEGFTLDEYITNYGLNEKKESDDTSIFTPYNPNAVEDVDVLEEINIPEIEETDLTSIYTPPTTDERAVGFVDNVVDFFDDISNAWSQGYAQGKLTDAGIELLKGDGTAEEINEWVQGNKAIANKNMQSLEMQEFDKIYEEAGGGWWGFVKGIAYNPSTLTTMLASSIATQTASILNSEEVAGAAATGGAIGAATGGGVLSLPNALIGAMTTSMGVMEAGLTFSELLMEEVGDLNQPDAAKKVKAILDDPQKLASLQNRSVKRGATIAGVELLTMGLAKGVGARLVAGARPIAGGLAAGAIEVVGGGLGEAGGRLAAGQEMDAKEIGFEAFAGLGSAPVTFGSQLGKINKSVDRVKSQKILQASPEKYKDISAAFTSDKDGNFNLNETDLELVKLKNSESILFEQLDAKVESGEITKEQSKSIKTNFIKTQGGSNRLSSLGLSLAQEKEAITKLSKVNKLNAEIKQINNTALSKNKIAEKDQLEKELGSITEEVRKQKIEKDVGFAKKAAKLFNIDVVDNLTATEIGETYGEKYEQADGFFKLNEETGRYEIVINKEVAAQTDAVSVGSHELLHGILKKSLMDNPNASSIIESFRNNLTAEQNAVIDARANAMGYFVGDEQVSKEAYDKSKAKNKRAERLYSDKDLKDSPDEYLTFFSDAIQKGEIKFEENIFTKIGDLITPILRAVGFSKIKFNTGKDVYNFMREYNKSIKEGTLSEAIVEATTPLGTEVVTETTISEPASLSKSQVKSVNTLAEQYTTDTNNKQLEADLINQYESVAVAALGYDVRRGTVAPEEALSFVRSQFKSIIDRFDPTKAAFTTHVNANIVPKRQQFYDQLIGDEALTTSIDAPESRQIADTTETETVRTVSKQDKAPTTNPLKLFGVEEKAKTNFVEKTVKEFKKLNVDDLSYKTLRTLDEQGIADLVGIPAKKIFSPTANLSQPEARKALMFITKNAQSIINLLPENNTEVKEVTAKNNPNKKVFIGGLPTGVPRNIQKLFYNKGKRIGNNFQFTKKKDITVNSFKKALGIEGNVKSPTFKVRSNTSQALKGMLELVGRAITNTAARQYLQNIGADPILIENIAEGKNPAMFSKSVVKEVNNLNVFQEAIEKGDADFNKFNLGNGWENIYKLIKSEPLDPGTVGSTEQMQEWISKVLPQYLPKELILLLAPSLTNGPASYYKANSKQFNEAAKADPKKYPTRTKAERTASQIKFVTDDKGKIIESRVDKSKSWWLESVSQMNTILNSYEGEYATLPQKTFDAIKETLTKQHYTTGTGKNRKASPSFMKLFGTKKLENQNKAKLKGLKEIFKVFETMMAKDANNAQFIVALLSKTSGHQNSMVRIAAPVKFIQTIGITNDGVVEEHTLPATLTAKYLFQQAVEGNVGKNFKYIKKNYMQGLLSKTNDDKLAGTTLDGKKFNYKSLMPDGWDITKDDVWSRYFNINVANTKFGLNPDNFILESGKSIFDIYNIDRSGAKISLNANKQLKQAATLNKKQLPQKTPQPVKEEASFSKSPRFSNNEVLNNMSLFDNFNNREEKILTDDLDLSKDFNEIIEKRTGIGKDKKYSRVKAQVVGAGKGKFNWFIPPSAEDFVGLLYKTLSKGKVGDSQMAWYKSHLLNPFARAMDNLSRDRIALLNDYKALKKNIKGVPKNLKKKIPGEGFTNEQAIRVFIWDQQGETIPGMSKTDLKDLIDHVNNNPELKSFADQLITLQKGDPYASPTDGWLAGTITTDLMDGVNTIKRAKYLKQWQSNVNDIFSTENLNKLEAAYGKNYRVALENILHRMKTGRNRSFGTDSLTGRLTDWLTNSIGAIMFFNTRSAVLQTLSAVNFINFKDNNVFAAGKAFANQPQFWSDFMTLMNSDFLVDRRNGLKLNVNEADIADMAKKGGVKGVISEMLRLGFLPTQIADSFAIASGGATFYRNRIKSLQKQGMTKAEAETQAFQDFRETAEESQQSSRPDRISQQQAGPLGRVILAFANTPAQYARLIKKAASDLKNGRGDAKTNISKIFYYGVAQNLIFNALQQAVFALGFGEEEDEEKKDKKYFSVINSMADSILRGIGVGGAIFSVLKNTAIKLKDEADKSSPEYQNVLVKEILQLSPPISSKVGKLRSAGRTASWDKKEILEKGWSIDNPAYLAAGQVIAATTNIPLDRAFKKIDNIRNASNSDFEAWQRVAMAAGWADWELGIKDKKPKTKTNLRPKKRKRTRKKKRKR